MLINKEKILKKGDITLFLPKRKNYERKRLLDAGVYNSCANLFLWDIAPPNASGQ